MRRNTVLWAGFATMLGGLSAAACSSNGGGDEGTAPVVDAGDTVDTSAPVQDSGPTVADTGAPADAGVPDATLPDATVPADAAMGDATVTDAGSDTGTDARADAGSVDSGVPVCRSASDTVERSCGVCGKQSALCTQTDAGLAPGAFSYCYGEKAGGCVPGTDPDGGVPCGRCGHARAVCQSDCTWAQGSCIEPPTSVCTPGDRVFKAGLSCPNPGEGRYGTCANDCTFAYGDCVIEETWVTASATVGGVGTRAFTVTSAKTIARGGTSGTNCAPSTSVTPYETVVVRNPSGKNLKVSIWDSFAPGSSTSSYDTVMNVFDGETLPATRATCLGANDTCSSSPCLSGSGLGGFSTSAAITLNAGQSLLVYTGCYSSSCTTPMNLVLNVKTEEILP